MCTFALLALDCPANMEYLDCGSADQPTCLDTVGSYDGPCLDGCFCQDGFVADGDSCIKPEDCGCIYNSQTYKVCAQNVLPLVGLRT